MVQFVSHLTLFLGAYGSWVCGTAHPLPGSASSGVVPHL